ncbi:hypothetical protein NE237_015015 [Protea cynaroides]|uniref:Retrotransposon Copia-like N-terminal domain-containing protein n=1 Tax=Protea cynaroides TaxID=273540 RepID=A0A9Q0KD91_9MAGN|nr:hypothetical protein NE237_015015 [Protea cynaroides]
MEKYENGPPIQTIFNCSNYLAWSQAMLSFLKGKKTWRYVTRNITVPTQQSEESKEKIQDHLEESDSKNHQAITWFCNSCIAKEVWYLLALWYTIADLAHQYQILNSMPVRASLLHRVPLPSLEKAIAKLISEETRLGIGKNNNLTDAVLVVPPSINQSFCKFYGQSGHLTKDCTKLQNFTFQHCHNKGHYSPQYCKKTSPNFLLVIQLQLLLNLHLILHLPHLLVSLSMYSNRFCPKPDPQTQTILGIERRCGRLFQLTSLQLPIPKSSLPHHVESTSYHSTSNIRHSRLGYPSFVVYILYFPVVI